MNSNATKKVDKSKKRKAEKTQERSPKKGKDQHKRSKPAFSGNSKNKKANSTTKPHSTRKHANVVEQAKVIWNQLRQKRKNSISKEERQALIKDELMPLIQGKCRDLCLKHDAARVVQAAIQFGNANQRQIIVRELTAEAGTLAELSQNPYAHFCVLKIIQYCLAEKEGEKEAEKGSAQSSSKNDTCLNLVLKNLKTHVPKLAVHAVGCRVVEALFTTLSNKQFRRLQLELYGPHVQLLLTEQDVSSEEGSSVPTTLLGSCLQQSPQHREAILKFVQHLVYKGMEKNLYSLTYFQDLLYQYCAALSGKEVRDMLQSHPTACDHAIHLLSSRAGTAALCLWISFGTAKDRKNMLKSIKGYARSGLLHSQAYLAFLHFTQWTDDTVVLSKYMFQELLSAKKEGEQEENAKDDHCLLDLALSESAHKLFLLVLLLPNEKALTKVLDPYEVSVLQPGVVPTIKELENGDNVPTSKKEVDQRHKELVQFFSKPLVELCVQHADQLLLSRSGSAVLKVVYQTCGRPADVVQAVMDAISDNQTSHEEAENVLQDRIGHLAVKQLILVDGSDGLDHKTAPLAQAFLKSHNKESLTKLALSGNRGAFVVMALYQVPLIRPKIQIDKSALKKKLKEEPEKASAGLQALLKEMNQ